MLIFIWAGGNGFIQFILFIFYLTCPMFTYYFTNLNLVLIFMNPNTKNNFRFPSIFGASPDIWFATGIYVF